jgi:predicted ATPase
MYIKSVEILEKEYNLKKGKVIEMKPITLLIGEQGCGKSSLLEFMLKNDKNFVDIVMSDDFTGGVNSFFFDTEKMNPRISSLDNYSTPSGNSRGIGVAAALFSHFQSHGETLREFTVNRVHEAKDSVMLLDEPEAALSIKNQYLLAERILNNKNNVQFVIATHCVPLFEIVGYAYDLEHYKWVTFKDYMNKIN